MDEHSHAPSPKTELRLSLLCGLLLAGGFALSYIDSLSFYFSLVFYIGAYISGGYFTTIEAYHAIRKGHFDIDFLMLVAAIGAAVLGEWAEGALLLFLFSLGHALEHYSMEKARKSITALAGLAPHTAFLLDKNSEAKEVEIDSLKVGDHILVKPNSKIAADGVVISGNSSVNQAPITGESIPVDKFPYKEKFTIEYVNRIPTEYRAFAGSINGSGSLVIEVTTLASDSTIARLIKLVREAQTQKSPTQNFTDRVQKYYVPLVLIMVSLLLFAFMVIDESFQESFYRAMAVLVGASPCALAISTPSAVLSGISRAAKGGVLIKGGKPLEELGSLSAIAFDKTGTLTEGKPKLTAVIPLNGISEEELLPLVIAVEKLSDHPLAAAIVKGGMEKGNYGSFAARDVRAITGRGVKAEYEGAVVYIGNKELFLEKNDVIPQDAKSIVEENERNGHTTMLVQRENKFIGILTLMDIARSNAKPTLERLKRLGITKMIMLTGDNQKVAEAISSDIGITDVRGNLLPEDKVAVIDKLMKSERKVAMVGDGVNDAPAMARSTVGIAMGAAGSDVALETADIALMADDLSNLPFAIGLSKKAHSIIRQNIFISLGMVAVLIPLTLTGQITMAPAVIGHEGSTVLVVFNALRLLAYRES